MSKFVLPPRWKDKMSAAPDAQPGVPFVELYIEEATQADIQTGPLTFFPEYTDHGPKHIQRVLDACDGLMTDESFAAVSAQDLGVLTLAVVLHDRAMHLSEDQFLRVIDRKQPYGGTEYDGTVFSWAQSFDDYFAEAKRWDGQTLEKILGDAQESQEASDRESELAAVIQHPNQLTDPERWTKQYRKFIGEFIRRQHGRLAHCFAIKGSPGVTDEIQSLYAGDDCGGISEELADLAGLVARSHSIALRDTFDYLDRVYSDGRAVCHQTHPIYLMAVLRIADYLEAGPHRAEAAQLRVRRLRSPLSIDEWKLNLAIKDIRADHGGEALGVIVEPESAKDYVRSRAMLQGLQRELDTTWAVLGEVYAGYAAEPELQKLGLKLRRVTSNVLDAPERFQIKGKPAPYYPIAARFDTAGGELLKLLIEPLYGDNPYIGVRELLQNSLDAVRELWEIAKQQDAANGWKEGTWLSQQKFHEQDADVLIDLDKDENGQHWLTVTDKGVGMTAETVNEYFLRAGASFRRSDAWRKTFVDDEGNSRVARTGRFGIGALAAFLLGDRITVETRHYGEPPENGVRFEVGIDDEVVELERVGGLAIGSSICLHLQPQKADALLKNKNEWQWFRGRTPKTSTRILGKYVYDKRRDGIGQDENENEQYLEIEEIIVSSSLIFAWSFDFFESSNATLNDLVVGETAVFDSDKKSWKICPAEPPSLFATPFVSIKDSNLIIDVNVPRNRILTSSNDLLSRTIEYSMFCELCSILIVLGPMAIVRFLDDIELISKLDFCRQRFFSFLPMFLVDGKAFLMTRSFAVDAQLNSFTVIGAISNYIKAGPDLTYAQIESSGLFTEPTVLTSLPRISSDDSDLAEFLSDQLLHALGAVGIKCSSVTLDKISFDKSATRILPESMRFLGEDFTAESLEDLAFVSFSCGGDLNHIGNESSLCESWKSIIGVDYHIPFDYEERREKYAHVWNDPEMKKYLDIWEQDELPGWRGEVLRKIKAMEAREQKQSKTR